MRPVILMPFLSLVLAGLCACAAEPGVKAPPTAAAVPAPNPYCVRDSATRLPTAPGYCAPGRSLDPEELGATGAVDTDQALEKIKSWSPIAR